MNDSLWPLIEMFTVVFSTCASAICDAMVRFHMSSYSLFSGIVLSMVVFVMYVGRIASCASWAPFEFVE